MTKRRFNFAKDVWLIVLCLGIIFFGANNSQAIPLTVTDIIAKRPTVGTGYLTQYWLETVQFGTLDAFCVEDAGVNSNISYALVDVQTAYIGVAGIASRYFDGSVIGLSIIGSKEQAKVATQLAIWQSLGIITHDQINDQDYKDRVDAILAIQNSSMSGSIYLAQSPADGGSGPSQDYLVSVPDASVMFLLGSALVGLGLFSRRRKSE